MLKNEEIINAINMLAIWYFVAYSKMKELTENQEEAIRLTNGLFTAVFEGSKPQSDSGSSNFVFCWDRRQEK